MNDSLAALVANLVSADTVIFTVVGWYHMHIIYFITYLVPADPVIFTVVGRYHMYVEYSIIIPIVILI